MTDQEYVQRDIIHHERPSRLPAILLGLLAVVAAVIVLLFVFDDDDGDGNPDPDVPAVDIDEPDVDVDVDDGGDEGGE